MRHQLVLSAVIAGTTGQQALLTALLVLIYGLLIVLILFLLTQWSRKQADTPADRHLTGDVFRADDRGWYGFIYINPDDPAVIVPNRYGLGWTVNFGHPWGKRVLIGLLVLVILGVLVPVLTHAPSSGCHSFGCHPFP